MPFIIKQKGKMVHLLKQKSKVQAELKPRKSYDPFDFASRKMKITHQGPEVVLVEHQDKKDQRKLAQPKKIIANMVEKYDSEMNDKEY